MNVVEQYIRAAAQARGINPDVAVRVAKAEGGLNDPTRQSLVTKGGRREPSYGPFQLLIGGGDTGFPEGLGNRAVQAGIDPRDPNQWQRGVDFALDEVNRRGWGQWYGAKAAGIDNWAGVKGNAAPPLKASDYPPSSIGGIGSPTAPGQNQPSVFGSMAPSQPAPMPDAVASTIAGRLGVDENGLNPLEKAGRYFEKAFDVPQAPAVWPKGDARQMGDALLKQLRDPRALAKMFLSQRLSA